MKLSIGDTWRLPNGEHVTILELPDARGWLVALSHETGAARRYGYYGFVQASATVVRRASERRAFAPRASTRARPGWRPDAGSRRSPRAARARRSRTERGRAS